MLADSFVRAHPVLNTVLLCGILLLFAALIVFAKPVGRLLDRINLKVLQVLGIASKDSGKKDGADDR